MSGRKAAYLLAVSAVLLGGPLATAKAAESLVIDGSTTVGPIADAFAEYFMKKMPALVITVKKTGSGDGAAALLDGRCDIAAMSRFMKDTEFDSAVAKKVYPVAHAIAMDGVCVAVHPSNPAKDLKIGQIHDIYAGKITNWKDLGGPDLKIVVISRDTSSGTYEVFHEKVMKKDKMAEGVEYVTSSPQMHARLSTTAGAIGYVGLGFIDEKVKALKVEGVPANKRTIVSGAYAVARPLFLFTNGYPKLGSMVHTFCAFYLQEEGQEIIEAKGFIPVTNY